MPRHRRDSDAAEETAAAPSRAGDLPIAGPEAKVDPAITLSLYVGWGWLMATLGGIMALLSEGVLPGGVRLSVPRAVFHAVSASTLTGFTVSQGLEEFERFGRLVVLGLTGVGATCALVLGGLAARRVAGLKSSDVAVVFTSFALLAAALVLGLAITSPAGGLVPGLQATVGALANSGAHLYRPGGTAATLHAVLLPLSWLGGLGAVVLLDVLSRLTGRSPRLTDYTRAALALCAAVFVVLTLLFVLGRGQGASLASIATAAALAGTVTGYGLPIEFSAEWPRALQQLSGLAMAAGLALGGTAAGVGVTTLAAIATAAVRGLRSRRPGALLAVSLAYVVAYAAVTFAVFLLLVSTEPQITGDRLLLLATGATANASVSHEPVSIVGAGLFTLSFAMLAGRALSLAGLWAMAWAARRDEATK